MNDIQEKINEADKIIEEIISDIRKAKEDYNTWKQYRDRLEEELHGWLPPPEPTRSIRKREGEE